MIVTIVFISIMLFIAGLFNGRMDYIKLHQLDSESWKNKWNWNTISNTGFGYTKLYHWWYFGLFKPKYQEKFPYSSTILVFITDEWHLRKWMMFCCIEVIIVFIFTQYNHLHWWYIPIGVIALKAFRGLGFTLIYDKKA